MLAKRIGIDLGSSSVQVYVRGVGVTVDEPSVLAMDRERSRVVAVGQAALALHGSKVKVVRPVREGVIADVAVTEGMLRHLIGRAQGTVRLFRPEVMISVPSGALSVDRRAMTEAAITAGARQAWLLDEPLAAAIGADLTISEPRGQAVCDIGGGTTEIGVISRSGMVVHRSLPVAGHRMDQAIAAHLDRTRGLVIDEETAERVKLAAGAAVEFDAPLEARIEDGETVTSTEIAEALEPPLSAIAGALLDVLDQTPGDLAADVSRGTVLLAGGGALLRGIDRYLADRTGFTFALAAEPRTCVARGAGLALDRFDVLRRGQLYLR